VRLLNSQNHYSHLNSHHKQEINQKGCLIAALFSCFNYFQLKIEGFLSVAKMDAVIKQSLAFAKARRRLSFYHAASALSLHVGLAKQRHAEQIIAPRRGTGNFLISQKRSDTVVQFIRHCIFSIITLFQSLLEEFYYVFNTFDHRTGA
jgi:hypothetical protein